MQNEQYPGSAKIAEIAEPEMHYQYDYQNANVRGC